MYTETAHRDQVSYEGPEERGWEETDEREEALGGRGAGGGRGWNRAISPTFGTMVLRHILLLMLSGTVMFEEFVLIALTRLSGTTVTGKSSGSQSQ